MKYIVIELQTAANGSVSNIVTAYDTRNEADSAYHSILASAALSTLPSHAAVLMTSDGNVLRNECYTNEAAAEVEPEPEG